MKPQERAEEEQAHADLGSIVAIAFLACDLSSLVRGPSSDKKPLTRHLAALGATLSCKGRG